MSIKIDVKCFKGMKDGGVVITDTHQFALLSDQLEELFKLYIPDKSSKKRIHPKLQEKSLKFYFWNSEIDEVDEASNEKEGALLNRIEKMNSLIEQHIHFIEIGEIDKAILLEQHNPNEILKSQKILKKIFNVLSEVILTGSDGRTVTLSKPPPMKPDSAPHSSKLTHDALHCCKILNIYFDGILIVTFVTQKSNKNITIQLNVGDNFRLQIKELSFIPELVDIEYSYYEGVSSNKKSQGTLLGINKTSDLVENGELDL